MKRPATDWEKISTYHVSDRDWDIEYINNSYNSIKRE